MDKAKITEVAKRELKEEAFADLVEKEKIRLTTKVSLWDRLFPYKIVKKEV